MSVKGFMKQTETLEQPSHDDIAQYATHSPPTFVARLRALAILVLLVGGVLRFVVAWHDLDSLDTLFFPDDTYLSLGIARNIALGYGSTFDRVIPTNGYQPLYVWLMVPVYWLLPNDLVLPIHIALTLLAVVGLLTAWVVYRLVAHFASGWHALVAAALWLFDPMILLHTMNGLETGIAILGIAATSFWYLTRIRERAEVSLRDALILGLLAGLTMLTRIDQAILLAAIGLDWLLDRRDRRTFLLLVAAGIVTLLVNLPWLAFGYAIGSGPMPESGAGVRFNALSQSQGRIGWFMAALILELSVLITAPRSTMLLLLVGVCSLIVLRRQKRAEQALRAWMQRLRPLRFAAFYSLAILLAYWLYIPAYWFFDRYLHPIALFALLAGVLSLPDPRTLVPRWQQILNGAVALFLVLELAMSVRYLLITPQPDGYLTIARWVQANLPGQTVGAFQAGAIGYWADQVQVVVLDGVVDRTALQARREGRLGELIRERNILWVLDWETTAGLPSDGLQNLGPPQHIPGIQTWGASWYRFEVLP
jgi:hypothetical protein